MNPRDSGEGGWRVAVGSGRGRTADPARVAYGDLLARFCAAEIPEPLPPEESYERRLARFGEEDHGECAQKTDPSAGTCRKPASLGDRENLKHNGNVQLVPDASGSVAGRRAVRGRSTSPDGR